MTVLDGLGLDIEQAVISCFNGFAMDVFRAEVCGHHIITICSDDGFIKPNLKSLTSSYLCCLLQQCGDGPGLVPDEIKAVLLHTAGLQNAM